MPESAACERQTQRQQNEESVEHTRICQGESILQGAIMGHTACVTLMREFDNCLCLDFWRKNAQVIEGKAA
jgi:hypothetical protein